MPAVTKWLEDLWYADICAYLVCGSAAGKWDHHGKGSIQDRSRPYHIRDNVLMYYGNGAYRRCLIHSEVAAALRKAHDDQGHFGLNLTRRRLIEHVYWPKMSQDVVEFVKGCWPCASQGPRKPPMLDLPFT